MFERWAFEQHPALKQYCTRLSLVHFHGRCSGTPIAFHATEFTPWRSAAYDHDVEAMPSYEQGAATTIATEAFHAVRQDPRLALLADPKVLRTMLSAQERTAERVLSAETSGQRYDLLIAGLRRAGLAALVNASVTRPRDAAAASSPDTHDKKDGVDAAAPSPQRCVACDSDGSGAGAHQLALAHNRHPSGLKRALPDPQTGGRNPVMMLVGKS